MPQNRRGASQAHGENPKGVTREGDSNQRSKPTHTNILLYAGKIAMLFCLSLSTGLIGSSRDKALLDELKQRSVRDGLALAQAGGERLEIVRFDHSPERVPRRRHRFVGYIKKEFPATIRSPDCPRTPPARRFASPLAG
jgi:hypothetical protein